MNTDKRLLINHLKDESLAKLKKLYEDFGEEEEIMWKKDYEKLTPILLNKIYDRRHEVIISCFSANPEGVSRLKEIIPCTCHEGSIIPEDNLRELITILNKHTRNQTFQMEIF